MKYLSFALVACFVLFLIFLQLRLPERIEVLKIDTVTVLKTDTVFLTNTVTKKEYIPEYRLILDTLYLDTVYVTQVIDTLGTDSAQLILYDVIRGDILSRQWHLTLKNKIITNTIDRTITKEIDANYWLLGINAGYRSGVIDLRPGLAWKRGRYLYSFDYSFLNKTPSFGVAYRLN